MTAVVATSRKIIDINNDLFRQFVNDAFAQNIVEDF